MVERFADCEELRSKLSSTFSLYFFFTEYLCSRHLQRHNKMHRTLYGCNNRHISTKAGERFNKVHTSSKSSEHRLAFFNLNQHSRRHSLTKSISIAYEADETLFKLTCSRASWFVVRWSHCSANKSNKMNSRVQPVRKRTNVCLLSTT